MQSILHHENESWIGCIKSTGWEVMAETMLRIRIWFHLFLGLLDPDPDPDPLVRGMDSDPAPDPSIIKQKY